GGDLSGAGSSGSGAGGAGGVAGGASGASHSGGSAGRGGGAGAPAGASATSSAGAASGGAPPVPATGNGFQPTGLVGADATLAYTTWKSKYLSACSDGSARVMKNGARFPGHGEPYCDSFHLPRRRPDRALQR
ncbi:MAG TPA: hypothetical protein VHW01_09080, partial [Polyangiaceae bacterium]|nr:hypothetical protein [Polyangiaceae bacterium]